MSETKWEPCVNCGHVTDWDDCPVHDPREVPAQPDAGASRTMGEPLRVRLARKLAGTFGDVAFDYDDPRTTDDERAEALELADEVIAMVRDGAIRNA